MSVKDAVENSLLERNKQLRIFILEDNEARINQFTQMFSDHCRTIATSAKEGIGYLTTQEYDFLFLDHDLGDDHYRALAMGNIAVEGTGYEVAKTLVNTVNVKKPMVIHSWNVEAAKRMKNLLGDTALIFPFGCFDKTIIDNVFEILRGRHVI